MFSKSCRISLLLTGIICCLVAGGIAGYYWFYKCAPLRHLESNSWRRIYSREVIWEEEKKNIARIGCLPDMEDRADMIGYYGDKKVCIDLMRRLSKPKIVFFCGCMSASLKMMTNHDFDSLSEWKKWMSENQNKSQEEWIIDGFAAHGVKLQLKEPLSNDQARQLLRLCADAPFQIQYNAYRWLRDSEYDTSKITLKSIGTEDQKLFDGLLRYTYFLGSSSGLGRLKLKHNEYKYKPYERSFWDKFKRYIPAWQLHLFFFLSGLVLLVLTLSPGKKKKNSKEELEILQLEADSCDTDMKD